MERSSYDNHNYKYTRQKRLSSNPTKIYFWNILKSILNPNDYAKYVDSVFRFVRNILCTF